MNSAWLHLAERPRMLLKEALPHTVALDISRDETVHLERALLVSVALPDRPWVRDDPLEEPAPFAQNVDSLVALFRRHRPARPRRNPARRRPPLGRRPHSRPQASP